MYKEHEIDRIIKQFVKQRVGGVLVLNCAGEIIYKDERIPLSDKDVATFVKRCPDFDEVKSNWDFADAEHGKYYQIETATIKEADADYQCHLFTDVSEYAELCREVSDFYKQTADISRFQSNIMGKLSEPAESCLADLTAFCGSTKARLYIKTSAVTACISYDDGILRRKIVSSTANVEELMRCRRFDYVDGLYCFLNDDIGDKRFALFLKRGTAFKDGYFEDLSVYNVVRLFIENSILREKIIYDSEHDALTGLYNKGKFMALKATNFGTPAKIAVFNFDVNDLKKINDNEGHEAGDRLIMRAADIVRGINDGDALCFRMGGDEFLAVVKDVDFAATERIQRAWTNSVATENATAPLKIACGMAHGAGNYDFDALMAEADQKMYENKKALKGGREPR